MGTARLLVSTVWALALAGVAGFATAADYSIVFDERAKDPKLALISSAGNPADWIRHRDRAKFLVKSGRCRARYDWQIGEQEIPDIEPGFRGLGDAVGLIASVAGAPATKAAVALEAVKIEDPSFAELLKAMRSPEDVAALELEIAAEWRRLEASFEEVVEGSLRYCRWIDSIWGNSAADDGLGADLIEERREYCEWVGGILRDRPPSGVRRAGGETVGLVGSELERLRKVLMKAGGLDCRSFDGYYDQGAAALAKMRRLRPRLTASRSAGFPSALARQLGDYELRLETYRNKLLRADAALETARAILADAVAEHRTGRRSELFFIHFQRLRVAFKAEEISPELLQDLADRYERIALAGERSPIGRAFDRLEGAIHTRLGTSAGKPAAGRFTGSSIASDVPDLENKARSLGERTERLADAFTAAIAAVNDRAREMLEALKDRYEKSYEQHPRVIEGRGPWQANQVLTVKLLRTDTFGLPDLAPLAITEVAAEAVLAAPSGSGEKDERTTDSKLLAADTFEVHRTTRWNVGAGVIATDLGERELGLRARPRLDEAGDPVLDDDDEPIEDLELVETGSDDQSLDYGLFVTYYLRELDLFPGEDALKPAWGPAIGFSLDKPDENAFLAFAYQPTLGVQLVGGLHVGRRNAPENGIEVGNLLPAGTAETPVRREWDTAPFIGVVFDAAVFRKLFAGSG